MGNQHSKKQASKAHRVSADATTFLTKPTSNSFDNAVQPSPSSLPPQEQRPPSTTKNSSTKSKSKSLSKKQDPTTTTTTTTTTPPLTNGQDQSRRSLESHNSTINNNHSNKNGNTSSSVNSNHNNNNNNNKRSSLPAQDGHTHHGSSSKATTPVVHSETVQRDPGAGHDDRHGPETGHGKHPKSTGQGQSQGPEAVSRKTEADQAVRQLPTTTATSTGDQASQAGQAKGSKTSSPSSLTNGSHPTGTSHSSHPPQQQQQHSNTNSSNCGSSTYGSSNDTLAAQPSPSTTAQTARTPASASPKGSPATAPVSSSASTPASTPAPSAPTPAPTPAPPAAPVPSIPFAVQNPGNPILVKKTNLTPLSIHHPAHPMSHPNRSPPPPSPARDRAHAKAQELSPTARLSFLEKSLGGHHVASPNGMGAKGGFDLDDVISRLLDAGYCGKISKGVCLKNSEILAICHQARDIFMSQPTLIELTPPVKIVGDIHGQYTDLLRLFEMCGFPPSANFLFLGDYVDRGKMSLETILLLFCYKIKYPENFFLLRGNHECANVTKVYGFYDECKRRASVKMWKAFVDVFNCLPLAAIVANKIFCVHGGLSPNLGTMDDIRALRRPTDVPDYGLLNDLLWSDPSETAVDWEDNERGVSYCFGASIIQGFLNRHDFDLVCRAHMVVEDGYEFFNDRTLVTVFSAPNYCGEFDNFGAVMSVNEDLLCSFELLKPIDQATAKAQMQSLAANAGGWRANKQRLSLTDGGIMFSAP